MPNEIRLDISGSRRGRPPRGARRGAGAEGGQTSSLPLELEAAFAESGIEVVAEQETTPAAARRSAAATDTMTFRLPVDDDAQYALAVRHPSGAITFHAPSTESTAAPAGPARRGARRSVSARRELTFDVRSRSAAQGGGAGGRRGVLSNAIKTVVLKIATRLVDRVLPRLAAGLEARLWKKRGLKEGWYRISATGVGAEPLTSAELARALVPNEQRSLLLIHGTFSDAGTYVPLTAGPNSFIERVAPIYGDRIFAYNHFTVSKTPLENARELAAALPTTPTNFDVITHSRGGLVLRTLVERANEVGPAASRIRVERAILVACPCDGTPLATAERWDKTFGWFANLMEIFPENPFTTVAGFVAEGIRWLAGRVVGTLPGLVAMDMTGETITGLQRVTTPPPRGYAALAAHYEASESILKRMVDVGIDAFFALDNDLVVPTRGSWSVRTNGTRNIDATRVGCFGPGGNIASGTTDRVFHTNFFVQPETVEFLVNVLFDRPTGLASIDLEKQTGRRLAAAAAAASAATGLPVLATTLPAGASTASAERVVATVAAAAGKPATTAIGGVLVEPAGEAGTGPAALVAVPSSSVALGVAAPGDLQIVILPPPPGQKSPVSILATYGSARVHDVLPTSGEEDGAGKRWYEIIRTQENIRNYVSGKPGSELPDENALREWGKQLFAAMLPGDVRRLYDDARARFRTKRMTVVFTSMIPWIADKPWEFAFDPTRKTHLATEEIYFVRNVLTAVPAEEADPIEGPLRILVVSAQPVGQGRLSIDEETEVIKRGFQPLIESGRAIVDVLPSATPADLHARVYTGSYHVVHLIAHGEFDKKLDTGFVLFQDRNGTTHKVGDRELREILCGRGIRLVFLNACDTGQGGHADFNSGIAPCLVAGGMPAVIANQYSVLDVSATVFAQHFYWSIAQGFSLGSATREARIAVNYSLKGEAIDWAIPVLYARDAAMRLCHRIPGGSPVAPLRTTSGRRSTSQHAVHVAVWDVSHLFPSLNRILERMNGAQQRFGFESVDLSVPIGTLRPVPTKVEGEHVSYLHADEAGAKLSAYPGQLGVNYLACIVGMPMMYTDEDGGAVTDAYGWWDADIPIFMFSAANFDLKPDSPDTDRAIANGLVASLAGARAGIGAHNGRKDCVLYENNERDLDVVTGVHRFCDAVCRKVLRVKTPEDLAAYDAILGAFGAVPEPAARVAKAKSRKARRPTKKRKA